MQLVESHTNGKVKAKVERWSLVRVDAEGVKTLWPSYIRPALAKVKFKDPHAGSWLPEHVRAAIDAGMMGRHFCECHLVVPVSSDKPVGFVILRMYNDEFVQVPLSLFVWISYLTEPRAMKDVIAALDKRAREIGVSHIEGISSRTSWMRRLRRFGFNCHQIILRREVP